MKTYTLTIALHIAGIFLSALFHSYSLLQEWFFCSVFSVLVIVSISIRLYILQMRQVKSWRYLVDCLLQHDLTQMVHAPFKDKAMQELATDLSAALRSLRQQLLNEEVKRQYYESLLNKVDTAVLVTDKQGKIDWTNRAADTLLASSPFLPDEILTAIRKKLPVVRYTRQNLPLDLSIDVTRIFLQGCERWIVSLKNIHATLERNEMEAWQKLIRVLTHEIMNSITPIISLAETLSERCKESPEETRNRQHLQQGLNIIRRRSKGLLEFVENYRKLTRIAPPVKVRIPVKDFFADLKRLNPEPYIHFQLADESLEWEADRAQMEQVFLNLLKNAREACATVSEPNIQVRAESNGKERIFIIQDNGEGILPDVLERIFIPFFTTKPNGSGIGLSLCKQIITLHGGSISATSGDGQGCCFRILFP